MSTGAALTVSLFLLGANAFFVGAEFALISARRSSIELLAEEGSRRARTTLRAMDNVSLMMAAAQLGITICSLGLGYLGKPAIAYFIDGPFEDLGIPEGVVDPAAFAIALTIVAYLHVVLGEMVPKNIAIAGPDRAALALGPPLALVVRGLGPAIILLNWIANATLRAVGVEPRDEVTSAFTRDEVAGLVAESRKEGLLDADESRLLTGALEFEQRTARAVLLPIERFVTVSPQVTPAQLEEVAARTGHSRFGTEEDGDLIGYLHVKDVLEFEDVHRNRAIARSWIRPMPTVQETDRLREILAVMQRSAAHLARVVDAEGTLLGVATLEDALEELVGEIRDEAGLISPAAR
jgi:CBS domain containing-hemolysin-like protein